MTLITQDRIVGLIAIAIGLFIALYWAPLDSETGLIERVRGRSAVGDALAPTLAGLLLAGSGLGLLFTGSTMRSFSMANLVFLVILLACIGAGLLAMRWGGPALVEAMTGETYRPLRDTFPWKYTGFLIGGTVMIAAPIMLVERQFRPSRIAVALAVALVLALFYDLPFEDLILPPNGDV